MIASSDCFGAAFPTNEEYDIGARVRAFWSATIALSGRILSNVCSIALLVNIRIAGLLRLFPLARIVGLNVPFSLSVRLPTDSIR
jgi:hypothetical protein